MAKEAQYQAKLKKKIESRFPGAVVTKMDTGHYQGMPDLLVLYNQRWALLEVKKSGKANKQPNQEYYVDKFNKMGFSSFIFPENEKEVLDAMERSFKS